MVLRKTICLVLLAGFVVFTGIACSKNSEKSSSASSEAPKPISELDRDINELERLVNEYAKSREKINKGDFSSLVEDTAAIKGIEPLLEKIILKMNELTPEQKNRLLEINDRMLSVQ